MADDDKGKDDGKDKQTPPVDPPKDPPKDQAGKDKKDEKVEKVEVVTLSKTEFSDYQRKFDELQKKVDDSEKEKVDIMTKHTLDELKRVNPKLADLNKDANLSTLKVVLETAKTIDTDFPQLDMKANEKPENDGVVGYRLLNTDEWLMK